MQLTHIDHLVLTVADLERACEFYVRVLGFRRVDAAGKPTALLFGQCKLNVHACDHTFDPKASTPTPGSGDFCLVTSGPITDVVAHLQQWGVSVEQGPVQREGAQGSMVSVYFRDPDRNLIEISSYEEGSE